MNNILNFLKTQSATVTNNIYTFTYDKPIFNFLTTTPYPFERNIDITHNRITYNLTCLKDTDCKQTLTFQTKFVHED